ncbi:MAG: AraC family transcriptional regulator ligand-binding domain-containing protein [Myxococcota bacterium]
MTSVERPEACATPENQDPDYEDAALKPPPAERGEANASTVLAVAVGALARGLPRERVEASLGTPLSGVMDGTQRVPATAATSLCEEMARYFPDMALSIEVGRSLPASFTAEVGRTASVAPTVGEALKVFARHAGLLADSAGCELTRSVRFSRLRLGHPLAGQDGGLMNELTLAFLLKFIRGMAGRPVELSEVRLPLPQIGEAATYAEYFKAPIRFGVGPQEGSLIMPNWVLDLPTKRASLESFELGLGHLAARRDYLAGEGEDTSLALLKEAIREGVAKGELELDRALSATGLSRRRAQRVAAGAGTTLSQLRDDEVMRRARTLLLEAPLSSVESIAFELGYSDARALRRAFKRAYGTTPSVYRQAQRSEAEGE